MVEGTFHTFPTTGIHGAGVFLSRRNLIVVNLLSLLYSILYIIVSGPKHPLAYDAFGVQHSIKQLWLLPSPVVVCLHPNQAHGYHQHTMGNGACTWFGPIPLHGTSTSSSWLCYRANKLSFWFGQVGTKRHGGGVYQWRWGIEGKKKGAKVGRQQTNQNWAGYSTINKARVGRHQWKVVGGSIEGGQ